MNARAHSPVKIVRGEGPVILSMPHTGLEAPPEIFSALNAEGKTLRDADWHVDRLYDGLLPDATIVQANFHRYVIDANRDPSGASLYPGQNTTGLVPLTNFDGAPIWSRPPDEAEIERRREKYHRAYHAALGAEIERVRARHGVAILYDCHSIRSRIPHLFEGVLPDLNIGTFGGAACAPEVQAAVEGAAAASSFSYVVNGRFKGGWTTRHYGRPKDGVHAIQMELAQSRYLATEAPPFAYEASSAGKLRATLRDALTRVEKLAPRLRETGERR